MRTRLLAIVVATLLLAGCNHGITEGTVTEKNHHPAYVGLHKPERWEVCFTNNGQHRCADVSKEAYDQTQVGAWFVLP